MSRCIIPFFSKLLHAQMIFPASIPHLRETGKEKPGVTIRYFASS